ncbi:AAA domain-containing protein [Peribacillus frigoritolerans]|uniref:AAA domain-containing protein n=1 Tax=Peribacillus frigoritolerans TaxID=450367 RepID=UPI00345D4D17
MSTDLKITKYFRDSLAAKIKINFKKSNYEIISLESIASGKVDEKHYINLLKGNTVKKNEINIIVIAKSIKTIFDGQKKINNNIDEMTGICYIPAVINSNGILNPSEGKYPWIPREHLCPIIEEDLAVGKLKDYDEFISNNFQRINSDLTWETYFKFAKDMYEQITDSKFTDLTIRDIELEKNVYIIKDESINATGSILSLYDHLLDGDLNKYPLYQNFIKQEFNTLRQLIPNTLLEMRKHSAQMGGEYPLSPSQRECVNHFNNMQEGDILAINGPPGTGKTTLLQSLVANLYVDKALKKEKAPLIVASSTNNQAVTNIIESFGKIDKQWISSNLEHRWVGGVDSFATYFPSSSKETEAKKKGIQYTNPRGENFFSNVESEENIKFSKEKMFKECNAYFDTDFKELKQCEKIIYERLSELEVIRNELLKVFHEYENINSDGKSMDDFLVHLKNEKRKWEKQFISIEMRIKDWEFHFKEIPFLYRLLSFLPSFKEKILNRNRLFLLPKEDFLDESMKKEKITSIYSNKAKEVREKINENNELYNKVDQLNRKYKELLKKVDDFHFLKEKAVSLNSLEKVNEFLDTTLKYASFWLAVHYYECRWLREKKLTEKQKGKNFKNVLERFYSNLSMLTPCFVMTFYQLPKLLLAYDNGRQHYLYNQIDLLIVDEAGQVTPEIAACSFSLAKRAVVVGDMHQIEPVWNINKSLDISLALSADVISSEEEFERLSELGLNTSGSSVMRVACKSCNYPKYQERGLFLSEHRRCYDEIIDYCNKLVYKGNLEPKRGKGKEDINYPLTTLSIGHLGHNQIDTYESSKKAGSRFNEKEADVIATWIDENFESIKKAYPGENPKNLIGIITPFKMQVGKIKNALSPSVNDYINVGTVHAFQGGERKVIIMSTVYGKNDGCFFIDANKSLLNVAVSRAKDSFLVFGDINCLSGSESNPSGLLRNMINSQSIPQQFL